MILLTIDRFSEKYNTDTIPLKDGIRYAARTWLHQPLGWGRFCGDDE